MYTRIKNGLHLGPKNKGDCLKCQIPLEALKFLNSLKKHSPLRLGTDLPLISFNNLVEGNFYFKLHCCKLGFGLCYSMQSSCEVSECLKLKKYFSSRKNI